MARAFLDRPVFTVGGVTRNWRDVLHAAPAAELPEPPGDLAAAEAAFRYARNLLSAEETEAWLARWDITVAEWQTFLRGEDSDPVVTLVCNGGLERTARDLALQAAAGAWAELPAGPEAFAQFRAGAATDEAIAREIDQRALDCWARLEIERLVLADADAALEAALCVRVDGMTLGEVADRAEASLTCDRVLLADVAGPLAPHLIGAAPGTLVGPVRDGDAHVLLLVRSRSTPSSDDVEVRGRAKELVVRRAAERTLEPMIAWHERL